MPQKSDLLSQSEPSILLIGGGGHCKSCIDVVEQEDTYQIAGIVDFPGKRGQQVLGYSVIGCDEELHNVTCPPLHTVTP